MDDTLSPEQRLIGIVTQLTDRLNESTATVNSMTNSLLDAIDMLEERTAEIATLRSQVEGLLAQKSECDAIQAAFRDNTAAFEREYEKAERLAAEVETLREALEPFAAKCAWPIGAEKQAPSFIRCEGITPSDDGGKSFCNFGLELEDFRRAASVLTKPQVEPQ